MKIARLSLRSCSVSQVYCLQQIPDAHLKKQRYAEMSVLQRRMVSNSLPRLFAQPTRQLCSRRRLEAEEEEDVVARRPGKMGRTLPPGGRGRWGGPQPPGGRGACCHRAGAVAVLEAWEEQQAERICSAADLRLHQGAVDGLRDLAGKRRRRRQRAQNSRPEPREGKGGRRRPDLIGVVQVPAAEEKSRAPWAKGGAERGGVDARRGGAQRTGREEEGPPAL
jgi:hypothetical protein